MRFFYPLLLALCLPFLSFAQSSYKPGYVVNSAGDTVRGLIDHKTWENNPQEISFKTNESSPSQKFDIGNMQGFGVNGAVYYQRYRVRISLDRTDLAHIADGRDTAEKTEVVFLKVLQTGKNINLYEYTDDLKTRFYISEQANLAPTELVYRVYYDNRALPGTHEHTINENTFQKQLFAIAARHDLLDDYMNRLLAEADYKQYDLLRIAGRINTVPAVSSSPDDENTGVQFIAMAGVAVTHIYTSNQSVFYQAGGRGQKFVTPVAGVAVNVLGKNDDNRTAVIFEASVTQTNFKDQYQLQAEPYLPVRASFNQLTVLITPQVTYDIYHGSNFKFYLGGGLSAVINNNSKTYFGPQDAKANTSGIDLGASNPYYFAWFDYAFMGKAGCRVGKHWGIFGEVFSSSLVTRAGYFSLSRTNQTVAINYLFK